jgi:hypothetical protein
MWAFRSISLLPCICPSAGSRVSPQTEGNISLSDVQTLVMDEADTLLDHSFYDQSSKLIKVLQYVCTSTRNIFISVAFAHGIHFIYIAHEIRYIQVPPRSQRVQHSSAARETRSEICECTCGRFGRGTRQCEGGHQSAERWRGPPVWRRL